MKIAIFSPECTRLSIEFAIKLIVKRKESDHHFWSKISGFDGSLPETKKEMKLTKVRLMLLAFFNDENIRPIKINEPMANRHYDGDAGQDEEFDISVEEFKLFAGLFDLVVSNDGKEPAPTPSAVGNSNPIVTAVRTSPITTLLSPFGQQNDESWDLEVEEKLRVREEERKARLKKQIPGKLPRKSIHKLVVKIAWEIEVDTGVQVGPKSIMGRLCELASTCSDKDCLLYADISIPGQEQVKWSTDEGIEDWFSLDNCKSALRIWRNSLPHK